MALVSESSREGSRVLPTPRGCDVCQASPACSGCGREPWHSRRICPDLSDSVRFPLAGRVSGSTGEERLLGRGAAPRTAGGSPNGAFWHRHSSPPGSGRAAGCCGNTWCAAGGAACWWRSPSCASPALLPRPSAPSQRGGRCFRFVCVRAPALPSPPLSQSAGPCLPLASACARLPRCLAACLCF